VRDALREMAEATGADELMAMSGIHDHVERKASCRRVADALGIGSAPD
jgi:hypothetical protein